MNTLNRSIQALAAAAALAMTAGCFQVESRPGTTYRVGSASSVSQLGASGLPQITFFQTSEPSAAFRQSAPVHIVALSLFAQ